MIEYWSILPHCLCLYLNLYDRLISFVLYGNAFKEGSKSDHHDASVSCFLFVISNNAEEKTSSLCLCFSHLQLPSQVQESIFLNVLLSFEENQTTHAKLNFNHKTPKNFRYEMTNEG